MLDILIVEDGKLLLDTLTFDLKADGFRPCPKIKLKAFKKTD